MWYKRPPPFSDDEASLAYRLFIFGCIISILWAVIR